MTLATLPGGETIWYKTTGPEEGGGPPLLQIHGSAFGHRNFEKLTPLSATHAQVIDFDLPGYGESRGSPRPGFCMLFRSDVMVDRSSATS